jgi:hypothetical protein
MSSAYTGDQCVSIPGKAPATPKGLVVLLKVLFEEIP